MDGEHRSPELVNQAVEGPSRREVALHVVLFVYLAMTLGPLALALKPIPGALSIVPFAVLGACAIAKQRRATELVAGVIFWPAMALASTVGAYAFFILLAPPVSDGHPVMPIGQTFGAAVVGPIVGCALGWALVKTSKSRKLRNYVLHAVGLVVLAAFVWKQL